MEVHHPVFYVSLGHMQNSMRSNVTLKLTLILTLTVTDTGGAVLTLMLGYRPGCELPWHTRKTASLFQYTNLTLIKEAEFISSRAKLSWKKNENDLFRKSTFIWWTKLHSVTCILAGLRFLTRHITHMRHRSLLKTYLFFPCPTILTCRWLADIFWEISSLQEVTFQSGSATKD